jgi:hypothetical protein
VCKRFAAHNECRFGIDCSYKHQKSEKYIEQNVLKEKIQETDKKVEEVALKIKDNELNEKVNLLETVVQKMFLNILKLEKEVSELKTLNKSRDIPEKENTEQKVTKDVTILEDEYQSKEETTVKDVDTLQRINNTKTAEINEDKLDDNLK